MVYNSYSYGYNNSDRDLMVYNSYLYGYNSYRDLMVYNSSKHMRPLYDGLL